MHVRFVCALGVLCAFAVAGCQRQYYRTRADQEASALIAEKSDDGRWAYPDFHIDPDPRSRYADVYDPDYPPMPPDDPASHQFMHYIDGKKHYDGWHDDGDIKDLENPHWKAYLGEYSSLTEEGRIRLTLDDAVQLAVLHSPDYQEEVETLYLSALDVSTERFRFDVQFFGGTGTSFQHLGEERPGGESNLLRVDNDARIERRFATAGELLVGFANAFTWEFFGPTRSTASSVLNFTFVQPLLRAGGRAVALEQLTIAERGLLANLRAFQRFRKGFYTEVAIGESGVSGPQRRGGFFGGTGLTGFTGQGAGGFGGVGDVTGFGRSFGAGGAAGGGGGAGFAGGGAGTVGGYIGLLQQLQQIRNTEESLNAQLRTLALLEANLDAGLIDIAQVDQFRQNIETERANLLQSRNALASTLDSFKRSTLGLPPDLPVELDDSLIQQFQFISPMIVSVQAAVQSYADEFGQLPAEPSDEEFAAAFEKLQELRGKITEQFERVPEDLRQLDESMPQRMEDLTPAERSLLEGDRRRLDDNLANVRQRFDRTVNILESLQDDLTDDTRQQTADGIIVLLGDLTSILGELSLIQARARLEAVTVERIELDPKYALEIARANRLDWMNNRAALVDTWRLIQFNANALKSDLSIRFEGDMRTLGNNPAEFRDETGSLRASLQFDPPFTRLIERNNFRQQLIEYQQNRRNLIAFEDQIHQNMRDLLRNLEQLRVNLEIQRRAVAIAIRRVDQTREALNQPIPPAQPGAPPPAFGPTLAQNLLFALSDLRNTQNNLMSVWLNYLASRMRLYRELGIMQVDEHNLWIDFPLTDVIVESSPDEESMPPAIPREWFRALEGHPENVPNAPPANVPPELLPVPPVDES